MTRSTLVSPVGHNGDVVQWLESPEAYPHRVDSVQRIETHVSQVFLAGEYVYKLKKPVHFDFLDLRQLAARELACREEVRLNRRLAPHVYLDVIRVTCDDEGRLAIDGQGDVVDWLVKMRRLPQALMLDELERLGTLRPYHVDELAETLSRFYRVVRRPVVSPEQFRQRVLKHVLENQHELRRSMQPEQQDAIDRAHAFQLQLLHLNPELFDKRVQEGRIVEGHGDLRPEHICFANPISIFDCIEFGAEFREVDIADELAFLAAECEFLGASWVGRQLFQRYELLTGDRAPHVIVDFYKSYRACVRAKVAALRASQLPVEERFKALREAARHIEAADRYASAYAQPVVLAIGGVSGSGKSTLAREIGRQLSARVLSSDAIRQELSGTAGRDEPLNSGKYSPEQRDRIYAEMFQRASELHRSGLSVVLDATFTDPKHLLTAYSLAQDLHSRFLAIECQCPPSVTQDRVEQRRARGDDASEATQRVVEAQLLARQAWPEVAPRIQIDTTQPLVEQVAKALAVLAHAGRDEPSIACT